MAPHTGVGRYILGLLGGLACLRGTGDFEVRALFAPAAALTSSSEARRPASAGGGLFRLARGVAKRLPFAYPLAQAVRAAALEAARLRGQGRTSAARCGSMPATPPG